MNHQISNAARMLCLILFCGLISACTKEGECENPPDVKNYLIAPEALAFTQNYVGTTSVIFENDNNEEVAFEVSRLEQAFEFSERETCPDDASQFINTNVTSQSININLTNETLFPKPFVIRLTEGNLLEPLEKQVMIVSYDYYLASLGTGTENTLFYYRFNESNPNMVIQDSLDIKGRTFYSVYEGTEEIVLDLPYEVKYTKTEGIVYIKDNSTGEKYTYLRKE